ncbi:MAG: hypothetical protein HYX72_12020 [Acidobacteria bacterium]|nr:hypothetical protein [Acidobacteriota bacterium]
MSRNGPTGPRHTGSSPVPLSPRCRDTNEAVQLLLEIEARLLYSRIEILPILGIRKESISAVEALCKLITNKHKATLGDALKELEKKLPMHQAFKNALNNLYGYTSDAEGIRHALLDESKLTPDDGKFMLVLCSAFVNYVTAVASKAGIEL